MDLKMNHQQSRMARNKMIMFIVFSIWWCITKTGTTFKTKAQPTDNQHVIFYIYGINKKTLPKWKGLFIK
jgi:hypothetical protein